jgi:cyclase
MRKCFGYAFAAEILAVALLLVLMPTPQACGQATDYSKVQIKTTKVSGNIYMIVDDQYAPLAEKIQAALKSLGITDKPVRFVINTHYHGDHTGGNAPFANSGSTVIAQDNVRKRLESGGVGGYGESSTREIKPAEKTALPVITFEHDVTVHLNGEDNRALHFPSGQWSGDFIKTDAWIETLYNSLTGTQGKFMKHN